MARSGSSIIQFNVDPGQQITIDWRQSQVQMRGYRLQSDGEIRYFAIIQVGDKPLLISGPAPLDATAVNKFYTLDKDVVIEIDSEKDLFDSFGKYKKQVKDYAFSHALRFDRLIDLRDIFEFYTDLITSE